MNDDLIIALEQIVRDFGTDVINDKNLANIVADYFSFDRNPAVRNILKAIVNNGYNIKISQLKSTKGNPNIDLERYASEIEQSWGYGKEQVRYVLSCIASSIGINSSYHEEHKSSQSVIKNLSENEHIKQLTSPTESSPYSYKKKTELNRASKYVFSVLLIVFVCIGGYMFIHKMNYKEEKGTVAELIDKLSQIK